MEDQKKPEWSGAATDGSAEGQPSTPMTSCLGDVEGELIAHRAELEAAKEAAGAELLAASDGYLHEAIKTLQQEIARLNEEVEHWVDRVDGYSNERDRHLDELKQENERLKELLKRETRNLVDTLDATLSATEMPMPVDPWIEADRETLTRQAIDELEAPVPRPEPTIDEACNELLAENETLSEEVDRMQDTVDSLRQENNALGHTIDDMKQENERLKAEVRSWDNASRRSVETIQSLKAQLANLRSAAAAVVTNYEPDQVPHDLMRESMVQLDATLNATEAPARRETFDPEAVRALLIDILAYNIDNGSLMSINESAKRVRDSERK